MDTELRVLSGQADDLLATTDMAFVAIDRHGRIVSWNAAAHRAFGWSYDELVGRTIVDSLVAPWAREEYRPRFKCEEWPTGENHGWTIRVPILTRRGSERYVELSPRASRGDRRRYVHSFLRDVTDQVVAESDARWLSDAINGASVALCTIDSGGIIRTMNHPFEDLLGIAADQLIGTPLLEIVPPSERELARLRFAALSRGEAVPDAASEFIRPDGRVMHLLVRGGPILSPEGRVRGMCFVARDVTPLVQAEREMGEQLFQLQQRSRGATADAAAAAVGAAKQRRAAEAHTSVRLEAIDVLLVALDARDQYTSEHSQSVVDLSLAVADELGFDAERRIGVEYVALLHDIGKLGIPDGILRKRGPLSPREWELMREHPAIGERIVAGITSIAHLAAAIRAEHERWDGGGYPDGLCGDQIPIESRIGLACDAWHAMTSDRPYREALSPDIAIGELRTHAGTQFDPRVVEALLTVLARGTNAA